jgi:hypothetical protein
MQGKLSRTLRGRSGWITSEGVRESWAALITTSPWTAPLIEHCLTQTSPGWAVQTTGPSREYRHSSGWGFLHHSASRARIIAGLFGFFTLIQFRDGPDR